MCLCVDVMGSDIIDIGFSFTLWLTCSYICTLFCSKILLFVFYDQRTPLHVAAEENHDDILRYLVEKRRDGINSQDLQGVRLWPY